MKKLLLTLAAAMLLSGCVPVQLEDKNSQTANQKETADVPPSATADAITSASIVPVDLQQNYKPKGFTSGDKKKVLVIISDPRKDSVTYDMANTAMQHLESSGWEVEKRDLYDLSFDPLITTDNFYYTKDGKGKPDYDVKEEQYLILKADHIIFVYPNWHDSENAMLKGYKEKVFAKGFAYDNDKDGLKGLLKGKSIFTIMNCGYLGGGRGFIGDGIDHNATWDAYMRAYQVFDQDTADFWGVENLGRFMNDQTPKNDAKDYEKQISELRDDLNAYLDKIYKK